MTRGRHPPSSYRGRIAQSISSRRGHGARSRVDTSVPQIYQDMLIEISSSSSGVEEGRKRPVKRRRVGERMSAEAGRRNEEDEREDDGGDEGTLSAADGEEISEKKIQTTYVSDASNESDMEWEEVDLQQNIPDQTPTGPTTADDEPLQLTLGGSSEKGKSKAPPRRKPVTAAEKRWRLSIHKVHLLCLLGHLQIRNLWCNDDDVQKCIPNVLSKNTVMCLNPKEEKPQFSRSTTFVDGLNKASEEFRRRFKVTAPGMRRPYWADGNESKQASVSPHLDDCNRERHITSFSHPALHEGEEMILSKTDFANQAKLMSGSRDFGAQVFCSLLRSVGVEARLVCSLQVLPFTGVAKSLNIADPRPMIVLSEDGQEEQSSSSIEMSSPAPRSSVSTPPSRMRRLGQPSFGNRPVHNSKGKQTLGHSIQASPYPVFWVEAFNEAVQKWLPVDPLVTKTVAKPSKLEPPASDSYNNMSYVIAFEDDASARDVTRRYTKSYNAKTRKNRVESTKDGETWWERTMQFFERPFLEDRDQVEFGDLTARSAAESMPRNIQDFKDHPVYALERHLRRNEVIHPKRVVGQVGVGKPGSKKGGSSLEQVYRRGDVKTVRSADGWYRLGRDIKVGEQPLKRVPAARNKSAERIEEEDGLESEAPLTPLYAAYQTEVYKAPPIINGRVPKNAYGNLDIYVPSMVPPGGVHIKLDEAARAVKILGLDYADAVTGFEFKGRHGTAVIKGIVTAIEYYDAIFEVISCLEDERARAEEDRRMAEALQMWKHLLVKMRVAERVKSYVFEGEHEERNFDMSMEDVDEDDDYGGGGFCAEDAEQSYQQPTAGLLRSESHLNPGESDGSDSEPGDSDPLPISMLAAEPSVGSFAAKSAREQGTTLPKPQQRYNLIVVPNKKNSSEKDERPTHEPSQPTDSIETDPIDQQEQPEQKQPVVTSPSKPFGEGSAVDPTIVDTPSEGYSNSVEEVEMPKPPRTEPQQESDSDVDQSSMLSHDPEDEDAEPEWLLSD